MKKLHRNEIESMLADLEKEYELFTYCYNDKSGGFQPGVDTVYYSGPYWDINEKAAILEAILSGKWLSAGEYVYKFEKMFSDQFNFADTVMVNSGSSANLVMMTVLKKYFGWKSGDEIILSPTGFPTTLAPIIQNQLKPIFVDIDWRDLNFDVSRIETKITSKTKGILISPVLGNPPDMDELLNISENYGLKLILDNCDSLGSRWRGKYLSDYCVASSCSFYPAHHITTGQGGTVSSSDTEIVKLARSFARWGGDCTCIGSSNLLQNGSCKKRFSKWLPKYDGIVDHRYVFSNIGYNLIPLDLQGAIGIEQLKKFETIHQLRRNNKSKIEAAFKNYYPFVRILEEADFAETSWFGVGIVCESQESKESLVSYLENNKIQTRNYFAGNLLLHPAFERFGQADEYPISNMVLENMFFIGCSPTINDEMIKYIEDTIEKLNMNKTDDKICVAQ